MDASGKQDVDILFFTCRHLRQQHFDHLLPQRETAERSDVPSTLATFEHEAARALLEVQLEQCRCGCMDVCGNSALFELCRLIRPSTRDQRVLGFALPDFRALLFAQRLRHEAEHAHAPGQIAGQFLGAHQHVGHLRAAHERECQERQRAIARHVCRKRGRIGHARHRALGQRVARAVRARERSVLVDEAQRSSTLDLLERSAAHGLNQAANAAIGISIRNRETHALAQRQQTICLPSQSGVQACCPVGRAQRLAFGRARVFLCALEFGIARTREYAARLVQQFPQQLALGAIETRDICLHRGGQG